MLDQKDQIEKEGWDVLVVLDACRYDTFERSYLDFLRGRLRKARSPVACENGVATSEWCKAVFTREYKDVTYISTTPHVNSKLEINGFKASDHFSSIIDLWDSGWDDEKGTVLPERVNEEIRAVVNKEPEERIIAHYMQPHFPYLTYKDPVNPKNKSLRLHDNWKRSLRNFIGSSVRRTLGGRTTRGMLKLLNLPPMTPMHEVLRDRGHDGLVELYKENLDMVLKALKEITRDIEDEKENIVITADHGEYLGEEGYYGHSYLPEHPVLNEVPWMELKGIE